MKSLYLRIWLTVVAALALFALVSGWMWQRHLEQERSRFEQAASERLGAWADLVQRSLPAAEAPAQQQAEALREWSARLRVPMALDDAQGQRVAASESFVRRQAEGGPLAVVSVKLDDGRTLWLARRGRRASTPGGPLPEPMLLWPAPPRADGGGPGPGLGPIGDGGPPPELRAGPGRADAGQPQPMLPFGLPRAVAPLVLVAVLFVAVAAGAYPVVRRLTRRLEALKQGVAAFGSGDLGQRVDAEGRDEVAAVAATFNRTAERIESLVRSHKSLLANASHELRSPLARLKMAAAMLADAPEGQRASLRREIDANIAELDALVDEVLLASRLDGSAALERDEQVDLLGLAVEEAARVGAEAEAPDGPAACVVPGSERLLRRALRNLLENARRYGGDDVRVVVGHGLGGQVSGQVRVQVCDRGPGVPAELRERIFEPFYRLPGHAEQAGGVGLGLSLVRQIAERHGGSVRCQARDGGGSCFVLSLPAR
ncbi:MAG: HAMP domain-containing histidine kinase [Burkholderiaceae bacterium]|nr:HAMP domain-containing histidine kinase [Burkholderiaceae bacterium]